MTNWIFAVILSSFFWSLGYVFLKKNTENNSIVKSYIYMALGQIILFLFLFTFICIYDNKISYFKIDKNILKTIMDNKFSLLAGLTFTIGTLFFIYVLKYGKNLPSVRITGIVFEMIITIILSYLYLKEKITLMNYLGILITLIGIGIIIYFE